MSLIIRLDKSFSDTSLPQLKRDQLLLNDGGGVKFLMDLFNSFSWGGGAPANGNSIKNINEALLADASILNQSGDALSFAGGGFDFSAATKIGNEIDIPAAVAADLWGASNQYFLMCAYIKLPTLANWNSGSTLAAFLQWASGTGTYQTVPELVCACFYTGGYLSIRRQNGAGTADIFSLLPTTLDYGSFAQIAFWRNADGQGVRLKTANGTVSAAAAVGVNNTQNFSSLPGRLGIPSSGFNGAAGSLISTTTGHANAFNMRIYRAFIENLVTSGRNPVAVLDADYARTIARGVFS